MFLEVQEIEDVVEQMTFSGFLIILQHLGNFRLPLLVHYNISRPERLKPEFPPAPPR